MTKNLHEQLDDFLKARGVTLMPQQEQFIRLNIDTFQSDPAVQVLFSGMVCGKTFALKLLEDFLRQADIERPETEKRPRNEYLRTGVWR